MWFRPWRHLMLALGIGCISVGVLGLAVYLVSPSASWRIRPAVDSSPRAPAAEPSISPAALLAAYEARHQAVVERLRPLLERKLSTEDIPALNSARDELVALMVPSERRAQHLQLVLKLALLNELLQPTRLTIASSRGAPTVAGAQRELVKLVASTVQP
ncbi:MAG: hypothetical protein HY974_04295 [Candidatus Kerfeldbacteria bacterium]|nr:hypothetical protein [Candidatus Kerfeldbacteria bacterium]